MGNLNIALEGTKGTEIESKDYLLKKYVDKEYVQYDFILMWHYKGVYIVCVCLEL